MGEDPRKQPGVDRVYVGDGITVRWEPVLCTHAANCLRALPQVFDSRARPWIDVRAASPDEIAGAVSLCPTGALTFERTDGGPEEEPPSVMYVEAQRNGPLYVRGRMKIVDEHGNVREVTRAALCRCGASKNKPFCDDSHSAIGFTTVERTPRKVLKLEPTERPSP